MSVMKFSIYTTGYILTAQHTAEVTTLTQHDTPQILTQTPHNSSKGTMTAMCSKQEKLESKNTHLLLNTLWAKTETSTPETKTTFAYLSKMNQCVDCNQINAHGSGEHGNIANHHSRGKASHTG